MDLATQYASLDSISRLKKMIMNYGPMSLNFISLYGTLFHTNSHCYLLYGWRTEASGQTTWLFKDSWPDAPPSISYTGNFLRLIAKDSVRLYEGPYILQPVKSGATIVNQAVYLDSLRSNGTYTKASLRQVPMNLASSMPIDINGYPSTTPNQYLSNMAHATVSVDGLSGIDSCSVHWSAVPDSSTIQHGMVSFDSPNGKTSTVTVTAEGYVNLFATVTLANGVQIITGRQKVFACAGMPFSLDKTYDACNGTQRVIRWQITSRMLLDRLPSTMVITAPWNFTPASGTNPSSYNTTWALPNDMFNIYYSNLVTSTGYGLHVTITDPGNNNISETVVVGGSVMPCGHSLVAGKAIETTVYPNPARNIIRLQISGTDSKFYAARLLDMNGRLLLLKKIKDMEDIDVSKLARGVYILQLIPFDKRAQPVNQKVILY